MTLFFILSKTLEALTLLSSTSLTSFTKKTSLPSITSFSVLPINKTKQLG